MRDAIPLRTARLILRPWRDADRAPFAAMNADPEVMRYFAAPWTAERSNAAVDTWRAQLAAQGWSNWAVEIAQTGEFIGFIGLSVPQRVLPFSPCVEIGWRLARPFWHRGYATDGAQEALRVGFEIAGLEEIVSFTTLANQPSRAVMERIGMRNANADFEHPGVPEGHSLRPHCLYTLQRAEWFVRNERRARAATAPAAPDRMDPLRRGFGGELRMYDEIRRRAATVFALDAASPPGLTLRAGDALDVYDAPPPRAQFDAPTDAYLETYAFGGLSHLDPASWRHYLPCLIDYALRHLHEPDSVVIEGLLWSLRPPDREPPRLGSISAAQEAVIAAMLDVLAFDERSAHRDLALQVLEEYWVPGALYREHAARARVAVRNAAQQDASEMARLLSLLGHPTTAAGIATSWAEWAAAGNSALVVPGAGGSLAGLVTLHRMTVLHRPDPVGRITALVVDAPMRGQGIGRALVAAAESAFIASGCRLLEITSNMRLTDAHAFYEHLGYNRTSLRFAKPLNG